ncbi:MAG: sugar ABC transporter ATP-binding protein [Aggregatilineales bacterium]
MTPILRLENIYKRYPGVLALDNLTFELNAGEVRALLGKNGAGKSTLIKLLSGAIQPDEGTIHIDGSPVALTTTQDAFKKGIYTVYQEMSLVPDLSVAENIMLGRWPLTRWKMVDYAALRRIAEEALQQLNITLDVKMPVSRLDVAQQQIVEIAKALSFNPRLLILDEPTSALAASEVDLLLQIVRDLAKSGRAIIYVSHRLAEIPRIADTVTILRDGQLVDTITIAEATPQRITDMMIGHEWTRMTHANVKMQDNAEVRLRVSNLSQEGHFQNVTFDAHEGEVIGIAGLLGSGRTELLRAIFGLEPVDTGTIEIHGATVEKPSPRMMKSLGMAMTPEDRKKQALLLIASVQDNLTLASLDRLNSYGIISPKALTDAAQEMIVDTQIKTPSLDVEINTLSGGNQQKVVVGNWLSIRPKILLMDEPSRGIDIQAKEQIFLLIRDLAKEGLTVLFVSSEIEEVLDVADRILVMNQGNITHDLSAGEIGLDKLMALVMGGTYGGIHNE